MRRDFFKPVMLLCLFIVFAYSYWTTSWTASSLPTLSDWKDHLIFTPGTIVASNEIYEIDMFLYALKVAPLMTSICFLSLIVIITFLIQLVRRQMGNVVKRKLSSS
ncbi:DUF4306 domain-containing protein [Pseudalkalibacillus hwajinpoensis]|uniref:DUF4306 domain-containing protein n=1 Tax=Guptibacillus hwajinpoensis TaxID=208199 RepID=UPI00325A74F9